MSPREIRNLPASVHQRLKNHAESTGRIFNEVLLTYAMERFLYRLSQSPAGERFVLKGGLMLMVWRSAIHRPTRDIDLLGRMSNDPEEVASAVLQVCTQPVVEDGMSFDPETVEAAEIGVEKEYEGVRVTFEGRLGKALVHMQVDVGFGDVVVPEEQEAEIPTTLDFPPPRLLAYPRETMIAEKVETMIRLDEANSRVRDFLDIWLVSRQFRFAGGELMRAMRATFGTRGTNIPDQPACFTASFAEDPTRTVTWKRLLERGRIEGVPTEFGDALLDVEEFVSPLLDALANDAQFDADWQPPGPWSLP